MARTKPVLKLGQRQHLVAKVNRELDAYLRSDGASPGTGTALTRWITRRQPWQPPAPSWRS